MVPICRSTMVLSPDEEILLLSVVLVAIIIIGYITKKRKTYFSNISQRELGAMELYNLRLYGLFILFIQSFLVAEVFVISYEISQYGIEYIGSADIDSFTEILEFDDVGAAISYVSALVILLAFTTMALVKEESYSRQMKNARRKLLLGELPEEEEVASYTTSPPSGRPPQSVTESNEPATFAAVLQAMDLELKKAVQAAEDLKSELDETKEKVVTLEIEVQEKDSEITQIKESKSRFDKIIKESSESKDEGDGKSLSLTDSVMVGDSVMGGVKIDKQINNDPEAIARAVIDAYRMGKDDSK